MFVFRQGCALDFFTNKELQEDDTARVSIDAYMSRRNGTRPTRNFSASPSMETKRSPTEQENFTANATGRKKTEEGWSDRHVSIVKDTIYGTLASIAWGALESAHSAKKPAAANPPNSIPRTRCVDDRSLDLKLTPKPRNCSVPRKSSPQACAPPTENKTQLGATEATLQDRLIQESAAVKNVGESTLAQEGTAILSNGSPFLFNEQYVVKPPRSSIEFGWHTVSLVVIVFPVFKHQSCASPRGKAACRKERLAPYLSDIDNAFSLQYYYFLHIVENRRGASPANPDGKNGRGHMCAEIRAPEVAFILCRTPLVGTCFVAGRAGATCDVCLRSGSSQPFVRQRVASVG